MAPWEIQGYDRAPAWESPRAGATAPSLLQGLDPRTQENRWRPGPSAPNSEEAGPWSDGGWPQTWGQGVEPQPSADRESPYDGYRPVPDQPADADGGGLYSGDSDRAFRRNGYAPEAYAGYRFRGDPELSPGIESDSGELERYRYRPLTENELERRDRGQRRSPDSAASARRSTQAPEQVPPRPVFGFEPSPWQSW